MINPANFAKVTGNDCATPGALRLASQMPSVWIGKFLFLGFLVVLAMLRGVLFWFERKKHGKIKKGLKTHCLRGLYAKNTKKPKATPRQFLQNQSLFVFQKNGFQCVIGNKYAKTCLKGIASLVTNARKGMF